MSTATDFLKNVPGSQSLRDAESTRGWLNRVGDSLTRFAPIYDWVSFVILFTMMLAVGWSVQLAGWGDLPSIIPTLVIGTIAAFFISKINLHWVLTILYAVGLGAVVVLWRGTAHAAGGDPVTRSIDGVSRFGQWIETAQSGGISTDTVPFALMFMTASWIVGYGVTALTFRFRSPWLPTVLLSLVILTNLSYRHGEHEHTFFLFLVGGIVLFAHLTTVRRIERWQSEGIEYSRFLGWATVQDGLLFALPIVLISALLPVWEPRSDRIHDTWDIFRAPFYALRDPANRLLAGVDGPLSSEKPKTPSQTMAFGGSLNLTEEPLMWVRSKYVVPFAGRVYQEYSSQGWLTDPSTHVEAEPRSALTLAPTELERERVAQVYVPLVDTKAVVPAGQVFSADRSTVVQILDPLEWVVPLTGTVSTLNEMPDDLRDLAFAVRFALADLRPESITNQPTRLNNQRLATPGLVENVLDGLRSVTETRTQLTFDVREIDDSGAEQRYETTFLPVITDAEALDWNELDIEVISHEDTGLATGLKIERVAPIEQVGVELSRTISKEDTFSIQTFVSLASDGQLNDAGSDYPTWVKDRYLQLPESLPEEVYELSESIVRVAGAETSFEKAEAIKDFLKSQEYSLEINGPAFGVDGIYYFLFETRDEPCASTDEDCHPDEIKGYSQYYGSAAAVMLRSVGVPARFVAGWAPGEFISEAGLFLVRDKDRHGWTQVYFPGYGWIDYEVTPGQEPLSRGKLAPADGIADPFAVGAIGSGEENPDFLQDIADLERLAREAREGFASDRAAGSSADTDDFILPWRPFAWTGGVIASIVVIMFFWWLSLRGMDAPTKAYARMNRIASVMGMRRRSNETAMEFAMNLGNQTLAAEVHATLIASEFQRRVYAGSYDADDVEGDLSKRLDGAWRRVARALVAHRLRQLSRLGPELGEGRGA